MARIDYSDPAKSSERTHEILGKNRNANIFRMLAHSPSHLEQYCRWAARSGTRVNSIRSFVNSPSRVRGYYARHLMKWSPTSASAKR
jgi:hypothetical protein